MQGRAHLLSGYLIWLLEVSCRYARSQLTLIDEALVQNKTE